MEDESVFVIINNIPKDYHSSDLRNYFSQFIESGGFECFHFRHRPEIQRSIQDGKGCHEPSTFLTPSVPQSSNDEPDKSKETLCCVLKMKSDKYPELVKMYHRHHWLDKRGNSIPALCYISKIKLTKGNPSSKYQTQRERKAIPKDREQFTMQDIMQLPELNPPVIVMPNGNVGTKTRVFLDLIAQCKLPPNIIGKLGLIFPKSRSKRRYGCVSFDYKSSEIPAYQDQGEEENPGGSCKNSEQVTDDADVDVESGSGHLIFAENELHTQRAKKTNGPSPDHGDNEDEPEDEVSEDDDDRCEEWERHEALHDDPANVERNKERLFEERIELKWEKGGSGLVFYTDAQFWQKQEGDFDEQTADDWDVDMSCYYEENGGDMDARQLLTMRQEKRRRAGEEDTDMKTAGFIKKQKKRAEKERVGTSLTAEGPVGQFQQHTKGVGRKVLEKQGWKEGEGVGGCVKGIASALGNEGQPPADKRGIGYYGEKIARFTVPKPQRRLKDFVISTVYDKPEETDPSEVLLRRNPPHLITHRQNSLKQQTSTEEKSHLIGHRQNSLKQ